MHADADIAAEALECGASGFAEGQFPVRQLGGLWTILLRGGGGTEKRLRLGKVADFVEGVGAGAGLNRDFGAAHWRIIAGVELFNHRRRTAR